MPVTRRAFLRAVGAGSAAAALPLVSARGLEAALEDGFRVAPAGAEPAIRLDSNENPNGPAPEVLRALTSAFGEAGRYPDFVLDDLYAALSEHLGVPRDHVLLGCGSGELLKVATEAFVTPERPLVTAAPTFETPTTRATTLGLPLTAVPVDAGLRLDLAGMAAAARGAGMVFLCNPNNPTGTVHGAPAMLDAIGRIHTASPEAVILVDEAYHEYVEDPGYASMVPLALKDPRVIVARTFSKIHGMAGLRCGMMVGHPDTLRRMRPHLGPNNVNALVAVAATASLALPRHLEAERQRNTAARAYLTGFFTSRGYAVTPSEANFLMVDLGRPMEDFRAACRSRGVLVGRPFPPLTTRVRISVGTMVEVRAAGAVFAEVLG